MLVDDGHVTGVETDKTACAAPAVVNCAGAWSGQVGPVQFPTRPVKGQCWLWSGHVSCCGTSSGLAIAIWFHGVMVGLSSVRRSEEAGFDKRTDADTIHGLHLAALKVVPKLARARILESWAGLRPGTPDSLPLLGKTTTPGYFAATGHFRDGILLTPVTAEIMARVITGGTPDYDISAFSPDRFLNT